MKKQKTKLKNNQGITLVALVVTIVVLLILAGVSINLVIGNNGLITKAQEAKEKTQQAAENDVSDMESLAEFVNTEAGSNTSSIPDTGNTDADNLISFSIDGIPYKAEKGMVLCDFIDQTIIQPILYQKQRTVQVVEPR